MATSTSSVRLRADQRPLYIQASEALRNLVHSGSYAPGDRLPSEIELSQRLGISRPTLREAIRLLEEEGTIVRRHGVGTFVAQSRQLIEGGLELLESIDRMAERLGLQTQMNEARIQERTASPAELQGLGIDGPADVTEVTRVIVADGRRVAFLADIVPQDVLRQSDLDQDFHGSVLDHFLERGWPGLAYSLTELAAEAADVKLANALHVPRRAPLLKLQAQLFADDGRVVDYSISYFVNDFFRFHIIRKIGQTRL